MIKTTRVVSVLAALAFTAGLASCSSGDDQSVSPSKVTSTTAKQDTDVTSTTSAPTTDPGTSVPDVSEPDTSAPATDPAGSVPPATGGSQPPSSTIPADFPKDVPLPDGKVMSVFTDEQKDSMSWTVSFSVADSSKAGCGAFLDEFEDAGFKETARTEVDGDLSGAYESDDWVVYVGCNSKADALALQVLSAT
jgi:hypothetical protein